MHKTNNTNNDSQESRKGKLKDKLKRFITNLKSLQGDPHYIAKGMAIGTFVGVTPTMPFHTVAALFLSFVFKGSKPAAVVGVWICNPVTVPVFYYGSYKLGAYLLGVSVPFNPDFTSLTEVTELMKLGFDITAAMITGGVIIGIPIGIISYFATLGLFKKIRRRENNKSTVSK